RLAPTANSEGLSPACHSTCTTSLDQPCSSTRISPGPGSVAGSIPAPPELHAESAWPNYMLKAHGQVKPVQDMCRIGRDFSLYRAQPGISVRQHRDLGSIPVACWTHRLLTPRPCWTRALAHKGKSCCVPVGEHFAHNHLEVSLGSTPGPYIASVKAHDDLRDSDIGF